MSILKGLFKKYFSSFVYFYRYLKYRMLTVIALSIAVGTLDAMGLTMFLPLLELADGSPEATGEGLGGMGFIIDWLEAIGINLTLISALIILIFFFVLKGIAVYASEAYKVIVSQFFISTLRIRLTKLFTKYSYKVFVSSDVGRIQNSLTSEIGRVSSAYRSYSNGIQQLIMTGVYMTFVFLIDWKFALLVCIGGVITNLIYGRIYKKTKTESAKLTKQSSGYHKEIIQFINNFKYLKGTGNLSFYSEKLNSKIRSIEDANKKMGLLGAIISGTREPILIIVVCIVIIVQIYVFDGKLATIIMSLLLFYRALNSLMNFQSTYNSFLSNSGSLDNISLFEKELTAAIEKDGNIKFKRLEKEIVLKNVDFGYIENDLILKDINLSITRNTSIAFVGESGSGKTTLVNLISGLLEISGGDLKIDDFSLKKLKKQTYQKRIGYIAQEAVIFNDTIFNNVTFWAEKNEENIRRFEHAINQASIAEFVQEQPNKEQTLLGNNGINLSGGQKQRISIARELYKEIDILILDEATSALDSETEKAIQYNIDKLKGTYTIIVIAHRLSTIKNVDIIYLMDKGRIIDYGNFDELVEKSPRFKKMVELQEI